MKNWPQIRITLVWLLLVGATLISFSLGHGFGLSDHRYSSVAIIVVAFIKVRFVMMDFMEIRTAPLALRIVGQAWIVLICSTLVTLYWLGSDPAVQAHWPHIAGL